MCNPVTTNFPDVLLAKGIHEGFEWEVTCNRLGYRCGYVRVPAGHPWHGKDYDCVEPYPDVHGGLTFAEPDTDCGKGGEDNAWWLGFDCAHAWDYSPRDVMHERDRPESCWKVQSDQSYRTLQYVKNQCTALAKQLSVPADDRAKDKP